MSYKVADRLIQKYLFLLFLIVLGIFLIYAMSEFVTAIMGAFVFYVLFKKFMVWLVEQKKWPKALATAVIILMSFVIVVVPISVLGTVVANKIIDFVSDPTQITTLISGAKEKMTAFPANINFDEVIGKLTEGMGAFAGGLLGNIVSAVTTIIIMYFVLYFMLMSSGKMEEALIRYIPLHDENIKELGDEMVGMTFSNAVGVPVIAIAQGLIAFGLYKFAGVEDAGFWATLTGAASIIPIVGTGIIWLPIAMFFYSWETIGVQ